MCQNKYKCVKTNIWKNSPHFTQRVLFSTEIVSQWDTCETISVLNRFIPCTNINVSGQIFGQNSPHFTQRVLFSTEIVTQVSHCVTISVLNIFNPCTNINVSRQIFEKLIYLIVKQLFCTILAYINKHFTKHIQIRFYLVISIGCPRP